MRQSEGTGGQDGSCSPVEQSNLQATGNLADLVEEDGWENHSSSPVRTRSDAHSSSAVKSDKQAKVREIISQANDDGMIEGSLCSSWHIGIGWFVSAFVIIQVIIVLSVASTLDRMILDRTSREMKQVVDRGTADSSSITQLQVLHSVELQLWTELDQMKFCAKMLSDSVKTSKIALDDMEKLSQYMKILKDRFGAAPLIATASDTFAMVSDTSETTADPTHSAPKLSIYTNAYNMIVAGDANSPGIFAFELTNLGTPQVDTAADFVSDWNPLESLWYQTTRDAKTPTWIPPHTMVIGNTIGIDACNPITESRTSAEVPTVEVGAVACCQHTVDHLSRLLTRTDIGAGGCVFIVENSGLLVAAATNEGELRVVERTSEGRPASISRLRASELSSKVHESIPHIAKYFERDGSWAHIASNISDLFIDGPDGGKLHVTMKRVGGESQYWDSSSGLPETDNSEPVLDWLIVIALPELARTPTVAQDDLDALILDSMSYNTIAVFIGATASFLISFAASSPLHSVFQKLLQRLQAIETFQFQDEPISEGPLEEIRIFSEKLLHLEKSVQVLLKYVPGEITAMLRSRGKSKTPGVGEPVLEKRMCTTLALSISNFVSMSEALSKEETAQLIRIFVSVCERVVGDTRGILSYLQSGTLCAIWLDEDSHHASKAGKAADNVAKTMRSINQQWGEMGMPEQLKAEITFGIHTGLVMIGHYGTEEHIKYGAFGEAVEVAKQLCSLTKTFAVDGLVSVFSASLSRALILEPEGHTVCVGDTDLEFFTYKLEAQPPGIKSPLAQQLIQQAMSAETETETNVPIQRSALRRRMTTGSVLLFLLSVTQIAITMTVFSVVELYGVHRPAIKLLNESMDEISVTFGIRHSAFLRSRVIDGIYSRINKLPQCANFLAEDFRLLKLDMFEDTEVLARSMFLYAQDFHTTFIRIGTRENDLVLMDSTVSPPASFFMYFFDNRGTEYHDGANASQVQMIVDMTGIISYADGNNVNGGFQVRDRPWYNETRYAQQAIWMEPFVFGDGEVGISSCVPVYDESSNPTLDPTSTSGKKWEESLNMVVCCENTLSRPSSLSAMLSDADVGENGIIFIVRASGTGAGALWAAADHENGLEVIDETGNPIPAVGYPMSRHPNIAIVSNYLLNATINEVPGHRSWADLADMQDLDLTLRSEDQLSGGHHICCMKGSGTLHVTVRTLDQHIPDWYFDNRSEWSSTPYQIQGMQLVIVTAMDPQDFIQFHDAVGEVEAFIGEVLVIRIFLFLAFCLIVIACCYLFVQRATRQSKDLQCLIQMVSEMRFERVEFYPSHISDVRNMQLSFDKIRQKLTKMQRYVSEDVAQTLRYSTGEKETMLANGRMALANKVCTVMSCSVTNFGHVKDILDEQQLVIMLNKFLETCRGVVKDTGGHFNDFEGAQFTASWEGRPDPSALGQMDHADNVKVSVQQNHEMRCCRAVQQILASIDELNLCWSIYGLPDLNLEIGFGIHRGPMLVGNYGSASRLQYGVIGTPLDLALKFLTLAKSFNVGIVVHNDVREGIYGHYSCNFLETTEYGPVYELSIRPETFIAEEDGPQTTRSKQAEETSRTINSEQDEDQCTAPHVVHGAAISGVIQSPVEESCQPTIDRVSIPVSEEQVAEVCEHPASDDEHLIKANELLFGDRV